MDPDTKARLTDRNIWARALYMLFFVIAYAVAETVLTLVVVFQYFAALVTGRVNDALLRFGANLSAYVYQILQFATFNDERLPYPFSEWPDEPPGTVSPWVGGQEPAGESTARDDVGEPAVEVVDDSSAETAQDDTPAGEDSAEDPGDVDKT